MSGNAARHPSQKQILAAKTKALDKYYADHIEDEAGSWACNFIISLMDWQFKHHSELTVKQENKLNEIYDALELDGELSSKVEYDYKSYL